MKIAITGSNGFIGGALGAELRAGGHEVVPVVRSGPRPGAAAWDPDRGEIERDALEGLDAVVHLAGEGIGSGPWTAARRRRIEESRSKGTALLAGTLAGLERKPAVLVSASGVHYYGDRGDDVLAETEPPGDEFLSRVCQQWESATRPAADAGIRTVQLRTGVVLDAAGGALPKQLLPFRLGLGGPAGSGRQWLSWITLADHLAVIRHVIGDHAVSGPVNSVSPNPVTNEEFTETVGRVLRRPTFLRIPSFVRRAPLGVGELAHVLLFESLRATPAVLAASPFQFRHPELEPALRELLDRPADDPAQ